MKKKQNRTNRLQVRVTPEDSAVFRRAAKADGEWSVGQWIRKTLLQAATRVLKK